MLNTFHFWHTNICIYHILSFYVFFNDPATTETYTLSLHDALPIFRTVAAFGGSARQGRLSVSASSAAPTEDRKSTRLNSSHSQISYAVFCLKKKKTETKQIQNSKHQKNN